jgi:hypothetical protein
VPWGLPDMIEPSTMLLETVEASAGAEIAPRLTDPRTILPLTLLFVINDVSVALEVIEEELRISPVILLLDIMDELTEICASMLQLVIFMLLLLVIDV